MMNARKTCKFREVDYSYYYILLSLGKSEIMFQNNLIITAH